MKNTLKIVSLLLALVLLCACTQKIPVDVSTESKPDQTQPVESTPVETEKTEYPGLIYFSLSIGESAEAFRYMDISLNEDGSIRADFSDTVRKVATLGAEYAQRIVQAFLSSGLPGLTGKDAYGEGEAGASMYVELSDGSMYTVGFTGEIPEAFRTGYGAMVQAMEEILADIPEYVPQPMVMGEMEQGLLDAFLEILNNSGVQALDGFTISPVAKDEYFGFSTGLTNATGVAAAGSCVPMMMTTAYSLVIVTLEDGADAQAICKDFENNLDWRKWVCVAPSDALIAQKENMLLCLMAADATFAGTYDGAAKAGWTELVHLTNPDRG